MAVAVAVAGAMAEVGEMAMAAMSAASCASVCWSRSARVELSQIWLG